ncbi:MAG: hypothetical protein HUJ61_00530 [Bacilli bacterium]|nr:hypothetical protein [Bacilli bacterium]
MNYVYVIDEEGFVSKKLSKEVKSNEKIISESKYLKLSGLKDYEKTFTHGGARENAGRKQKYSSPLKYQIRVTQEEKDFIMYAREKNFDYLSAMQQQ